MTTKVINTMDKNPTGDFNIEVKVRKCPERANMSPYQAFRQGKARQYGFFKKRAPFPTTITESPEEKGVMKPNQIIWGKGGCHR